MVKSCPSWMHYCAKGKDWSTLIISLGCVSMCVLLVCCISLFILYRVNMHQLVHMRQHYKIFVAVIVCVAFRVPWWFMNIVTYEDDSPPVIAVLMLNRICMLALYLAQSFYVQTWLRVILALRQFKNESVLKILFFALDSIITILMLCEIVYKAFDVSTPTGYSFIYELGVDFMACCSLLSCILYLSVGSVLLFKLKSYFSFCSKTIQSFVIVSVILTLSALSRFVCLFYKSFFNKFMKNELFAVFCYFVPDFVPICCILVMQTVVYSGERKKRSILHEQEASTYT
ncbi:Conserved_hypothetical protein [Hexamita inflata]|uniref:Uncharacterized protein n=1 Tax=Hexamita inflata TaxID=28002 RepID=A0AA86UWR7_9EUKA|nr:Conserved hypothetical protein [Hexamita inflata]